VFKPFVYLAALERGLTPDSTTFDLPLDIHGWSPKNADGRFQGAVTLRVGLAQSLNTVAVRLQQDVGTRPVIEVARRLGISSPLREDASLALGTSEVTVVELAGAYAALSSGGRRVAPHVIRRVLTERGRVLFAQAGAAREPAVAAKHVAQMNDMLGATLLEGTGRRARLAGHPAAGKTGTTQDFRDAWFVGYTGHLVAGVWFGNDDSKPMSRVSGGSLPAMLWHDIMTKAHQGLAPRALPAIDATPDVPSREGQSPQPIAGAPVRTEEQMTSSAQPVVINSPTVTLPRRKSEPRTRVTRRAPDKAQRRPSEPIDAALFARAAGETPSGGNVAKAHVPAAAPAATAPSEQARNSSFNPNRIREALGNERSFAAPPRMGLGAGQ
jgi:penicillin-binding protein 1A